MQEGNQQTFIYKLATGVDETGLIPDGHYNLVLDLIRKLNRCMMKEAQSKIKFSYVANKCKVKINVPKGGYVLITGDTPDIVDAQFVGDVKVPLLRIVNTQGNCGDNVNVSFRYMQYVTIKVKSLQTIEINIKGDNNENVSFGFGKSIVTLHFKQSRLQYFI